MIFLAAQVLPGDVGRRVLGPFADQASVDALNQELGTDQPLDHPVLGLDLGRPDRRPRRVDPRTARSSDVISDPLVASAKLALLAFVIVVPLAIVGGVSRRCTRAAPATA